MARIHGLTEPLRLRLFVDNLRKMVRRFMDDAMNSERPLVYYVLASVLHDILSDWEGRALTTEEAKKKEQEIGPWLEEVFRSAGHDGPKLWSDLNNLLVAHLQNGKKGKIAVP